MYTAGISGVYRMRVFGFAGAFDPGNPYTLRVRVGVLGRITYLPLIRR